MKKFVTYENLVIPSLSPMKILSFLRKQESISSLWFFWIPVFTGMTNMEHSHFYMAF